jgi:parallel beta-helix repeat protein
MIERGFSPLPTIDRGFSPARLGKGRNRSSQVYAVAMILFVVLMLCTDAGFMIQIGNNAGQHHSETSVTSPAGILYATHSPIAINGNAGFTDASGVVGGNGTANDPYIIANWEIDASTANGIFIQGTDAYFVVRDCYVHDGASGLFYGIRLSDCTNGTLENNYLLDNNDGISLFSSRTNTLVNNTCSSNSHYGIEHVFSSHNTLADNNCSWNGFVGVYFYSSSVNTLVNNTCNSNAFLGIWLSSSSDNNALIGNTCSSNIQEGTGGIYSWYSSNNALIDNTCNSNTWMGIMLAYSRSDTLSNNSMMDDGIIISGSNILEFNTHSIDTSNIVNGKPVYYYKDQNGITVPAGAGQVILANCTNMTVENESLSHCTVGIQLSYCSGIAVTNNTCSLDYDGMRLTSSSSNTIIDNTCSSNKKYGIKLVGSSGNTLANNTCSSDDTGIYVYIASNNCIVNNTCSSNYNEGISLGSSDDNVVKGNHLSSNRFFGVLIATGSSNMIFNNTFIDNNGATDTYNASHIQACDDGTSNRWNSSGDSHGYGNYWSDHTGPDEDMDGIVDLPYSIRGKAGAKDYYPLTIHQTPIPEFSMMPFVVMVLLVAIVLTVGARRRKAR